MMTDGVGSQVKEADDFGATTFDHGGFVTTEEVWTRGVPSRAQAY